MHKITSNGYKVAILQSISAKTFTKLYNRERHIQRIHFRLRETIVERESDRIERGSDKIQKKKRVRERERVGVYPIH